MNFMLKNFTVGETLQRNLQVCRETKQMSNSVCVQRQLRTSVSSYQADCRNRNKYIIMIQQCSVNQNEMAYIECMPIIPAQSHPRMYKKEAHLLQHHVLWKLYFLTGLASHKHLQNVSSPKYRI